MKSSESVKELQAALVKARSSIQNLNPSAKGYGYTYVPLERVIDHLKEVLPGLGLGYIQLPFDGGADIVGLTTRVFHISGEWLEESAKFPLTDMKGVNKSQMAGSAITYFRRYALCSAFGITGDEEADVHKGNGDGPALDPEVYDWETSLSIASSKEELQAAWGKATAKYGKDVEAMKILTAAKDAKKKELGL